MQVNVLDLIIIITRLLPVIRLLRSCKQTQCWKRLQWADIVKIVKPTPPLEFDYWTMFQPRNMVDAEVRILVSQDLLFICFHVGLFPVLLQKTVSLKERNVISKVEKVRGVYILYTIFTADGATFVLFHTVRLPKSIYRTYLNYEPQKWHWFLPTAPLKPVINLNRSKLKSSKNRLSHCVFPHNFHETFRKYTPWHSAKSPLKRFVTTQKSPFKGLIPVRLSQKTWGSILMMLKLHYEPAKHTIWLRDKASSENNQHFCRNQSIFCINSLVLYYG